MSSITSDAPFDLAASKERVAFAKALAAGQHKVVAGSSCEPPRFAVDLLFLLQENVLVLTETHALLTRLDAEANQKAIVVNTLPAAPPPAYFRRSRQIVLLSLALALASTVWVVAIELLDPTPMDVSAASIHLP